MTERGAPVARPPTRTPRGTAGATGRPFRRAGDARPRHMGHLMTRHLLAAAAALLAGGALAQDTGPGDPASVESDAEGRHWDAAGLPTYSIAEDGTVDWPTFSGFRRYHAECHTCHGPDGEGSTYAPALVESVQAMDYFEFYNVIVKGRENVHGGTQNVMPAFGDNLNVMCYLDDIYVYLRARGQGELPRGRPAQKVAKTEAFGEYEDSCMGMG